MWQRFLVVFVVVMAGCFSGREEQTEPVVPPTCDEATEAVLTRLGGCQGLYIIAQDRDPEVECRSITEANPGSELTTRRCTGTGDTAQTVGDVLLPYCLDMRDACQ